MSRVHSGRAPRAQFILVLWVLLSALPLAAYIVPLWQNALADTPLAYLIWVPLLGFVWAIWELHRAMPYPDDREINFLLGGGLLLLSGFILAAGPVLWPFSFIGADAGLLVWPFWVLGTAWLLFGVGTTRPLVWPLAYFVLAWPPLFTIGVEHSQTILTGSAVRIIGAIGSHLSWMRPIPPSGTYLISHAGAQVPVYITSACSGADSLLAVIIVLPILLTQFLGSAWRKWMLVVVASLLALVLNLVRLLLLIVSVHLNGPAFALGVLHPVLGIVLFMALVIGLAMLAVRMGLRPAQGDGSLRQIALPGWRRSLTAVLAAGALGALLAPVVLDRTTLQGTPISETRPGLMQVLPGMPGFRRTPLGNFDDASILGPGSVSSAVAYSTASGAYVMAELWRTPDLGTLSSYTYANCLLFHGSTILAVRPFLVAGRTPAVLYAVDLPPSRPGGKPTPWLDVEWTLSVTLDGSTQYVRVAIATPRQDASRWLHRFQTGVPATPSGLQAIAVPAPSGALPADLERTAAVLMNFAVRFQSELLRSMPAPAADAPVAGRTAAGHRRPG